MAHHLPPRLHSVDWRPSSPVSPAGWEWLRRLLPKPGGRSSVGRAPPLQGGGRGFEPPRLHQRPTPVGARPHRQHRTPVDGFRAPQQRRDCSEGNLGVAHLLRRFGAATLPSGHAASGHLHNRILREFDDSKSHIANRRGMALSVRVCLPQSGDRRVCLTEGQVTKGTRWMPWRQEPMKDVARLR